MKRRKLSWISSILAGLTLFIVGCQAFASTYEYQGTLVNGAEPMPDFELMAATGQPFRLSDVEGDIALIYFGYTNCPDVCPLTMWEVKKAVESLEYGRERVHVIFITADPERDTPEVLSRYMAVFGHDFIGLSDDFDKVETVMKSYGAFAEKEEIDNSALRYLVSHTATLFLIDPERRLLLQYPFGFVAEDLSSDLTYLLEQEISN